jgi:hypothetical protein
VAAGVALALAFPALGCSSTTATSPTGSTAAATGASGTGASGTGAPGTRFQVSLPTAYATIADLQKALQDKSITCKLEYPGLKDDTSKQELSICVIDGEQAYLRIWLDPAGLTQFLASPDGQTGTVAAGSNWTITVASNPVATKIATALGGTAPSGSGAATGSTPTR